MKAILHSVKQDIQKGDQVIILGDMNEDVVKGELNKELEGMGLINVVTQHLMDFDNVRTYNRGSSIIDGIWCTSRVGKSVLNFGMAPF